MPSYPENIHRHAIDPTHVGTVEGATRTVSMSNAACGDELVWTASVRDGRVERILFRARSCSAVLATASLAAEALEGRSVEEARALDVAALMEEAGGLPPGKRHAVQLVARSLEKLLGVD